MVQHDKCGVRLRTYVRHNEGGLYGYRIYNYNGEHEQMNDFAYSVSLARLCRLGKAACLKLVI